MGSLSQRLHLGVQQKQVLTPGLVQMVTVLQLNRLELKDMLMNEIAENPVLEEAADGAEELTQAEVQELLEREHHAEPADHDFLDRSAATESLQVFDAPEIEAPPVLVGG
jgi:RNA polymerase sigma-54 factor